MKSIFESGEIMGYYAQIDYCYIMLKELYADFSKPLSPIEQRIDMATGHSKDKTKKTKEAVIELLKTIIDCKKKIEADYSNDEKALRALTTKQK